MMKMVYDIGKMSAIELTPDVARELLAKSHVPNRPQQMAHIAKLAEDMVTGRWCAGTILVEDTNGSLVDGQHRCMAVIESNVPIHAWLYKLADNKYAETIDLEIRPRSVRDILGMYHDMKVSNTVVSAITLEARDFQPGKAKKQQSKTAIVAHALTLAPKLRDMLERLTIGRTPRLRAATLAVALRAAKKRGADREAVEAFFTSVSKNEGPPQARMLATWLFNNPATGHQNTREACFKSIVCWNAHKTGEKFSKLPAYTSDRKLPEVL